MYLTTNYTRANRQRMNEQLTRPVTTFEGCEQRLNGPYIEVALAVRTFLEETPPRQLLTFDDVTGQVVDFDLRGSKKEMLDRILVQPAPEPTDAEDAPQTPRGRGRPKLGVVAREVTLLPRHWQWLKAQSGGASAALRRLVDAARQEGKSDEHALACRDAAYNFMSALGGNLPGFEEASRAHFAGDRAKFEAEIAEWPVAVQAYILKLADRKPAS